jgi:phosphoribosylanthranilate isomerase
VKVCCITNEEDLQQAVGLGADALGFVGPMPSGTGIVDLATARQLIAAVPPAVASFLLTSATHPDTLVDEAAETGASVLQIVDRVPALAYARLRQALPALRLVQVVHVEGEETLAEAVEAARHVDAILLDSGSRAGPVALLGGTGQVHDWAISRRIVETIGKPVILAGGLRPENVAEAIGVVRPYAVDVCTGLRTAGRLDPAKLRSFMAAVARASTTTRAAAP